MEPLERECLNYLKYSVISITKNWKNYLTGQAYDGVSNIKGAVKKLKTLIQNKNKNALYVWCGAHCLNLAIFDYCEAIECIQDYFSTLGI